MQERLDTILNENIDTSNSMYETRQLIEDYQQGIVDVLNPQLQDLKREGDSRISLASEKRKLVHLKLLIQFMYFFFFHRSCRSSK